MSPKTSIFFFNTVISLTATKTLRLFWWLFVLVNSPHERPVTLTLLLYDVIIVAVYDENNGKITNKQNLKKFKEWDFTLGFYLLNWNNKTQLTIHYPLAISWIPFLYDLVILYLWFIDWIHDEIIEEFIYIYIYMYIESIKTMYMEDVSTRVLEKIKNI